MAENTQRKAPKKMVEEVLTTCKVEQLTGAALLSRQACGMVGAPAGAGRAFDREKRPQLIKWPGWDCVAEGCTAVGVSHPRVTWKEAK